MVGLGFLFPALAALGILLYEREDFFRKVPGLGALLKVREKLKAYPLSWVFVLAIPLPYLAIECGWMLAEVGRQPWIVYGKLRVAEAVSPIAFSQVAVSLFGFIAVYSLLGLVDFYLLVKYAARGPGPAPGPGKEG
jgi:cytochrome d ubiquinol oxidase subunit I